MVALGDLINDGDGIIGIADDGFAAIVELQLFAGKNILAGALAVSLEIGSRGNEGPAHVLALAQLGEGLAHRGGERLERVREVRGVNELCLVLGVHVQRACAADNDETRVGARENVRQVLERGGVL